MVVLPPASLVVFDAPLASTSVSPLITNFMLLPPSATTSSLCVTAVTLPLVIPLACAPAGVVPRMRPKRILPTQTATDRLMLIMCMPPHDRVAYEGPRPVVPGPNLATRPGRSGASREPPPLYNPGYTQSEQRSARDEPELIRRS